jgi:DNA-binding CsgD family transcriptional regulator
MDTNLIDRIYESAFTPEAWPDVLADFAKIADARFGWMFVSNSRKVRRWTASTARARAGMAPFFVSGHIDRSDRMKRLLGAGRSGFVIDDDIYRPGEWERDPDVRGFRLVGLGWATGTAISLPTEESFGLVLEREYARGPVERERVDRLDELRPHLARSVLIAARLQMERARAAGETLAALGLPALVLDEQGKVLAANSLVEGLVDFVLWRALDRVSLIDRSADQLLRDAIAAIDSPQGSVRSFPVRHAESGGTMVAHLIPIRLSARDVFLRCSAALVLTPVTAPKAPPVELVQSLFDLTPAEAKVARGLAAGETVDSHAFARGVSENTIRMQVRGVLEKTGCARQIDVVALLTAVSSVRLPNNA